MSARKRASSERAVRLGGVAGESSGLGDTPGLTELLPLPHLHATDVATLFGDLAVLVPRGPLAVFCAAAKFALRTFASPGVIREPTTLFLIVDISTFDGGLTI